MGLNFFSLIKKLDLFGRQIKLNFTDGKSRMPTFKTVCGGIMSLFLFISLLTNLVHFVDKMYAYELDSISTIERKLNWDDAG